MKNYIVGIAIIILTISVVVYGVNTVYRAPQYNDFCPNVRYYPMLNNKTACPTVCVPMYELQNESCVYNNCGSGCGPDGVKTFDTLKQCQVVLGGNTCSTVYDNAQSSYSRNLFLVTLPLGIIIIVIGALAFGLEAVGAGLMGGGVGVILWGVGSFWGFADNWLKFLLSFAGLVVVIWLAYYFNKKFEKRKRRRR